MRVTIGIISYRDYNDMVGLLYSISIQQYKDFEVYVLGADGDLDIKEIVSKYGYNYLTHPDGNVGFGRGHNFIIKKCYENIDEGYHILLNSDMVLDSDFILNIINTFQTNIDADILCPKIYKVTDLTSLSKNSIDACGIILQKDLNCYNEMTDIYITKEVYGFTGASLIFNMKKCLKLKDLNKSMYGDDFDFFDPMFFMYKEDTDLNMRLRLLGYRIYLTTKSVVYHRRTLVDTYYMKKNIFTKYITFFKERKKTSTKLKYWSFCNHRIYILKYWSFKLGLKTYLWVLLSEFRAFVYCFFYPSFFKAYKEIWDNRRSISHRRKQRFLYNYNNIKKWIV